MSLCRGEACLRPFVIARRAKTSFAPTEIAISHELRICAHKRAALFAHEIFPITTFSRIPRSPTQFPKIVLRARDHKRAAPPEKGEPRAHGQSGPEARAKKT